MKPGAGAPALSRNGPHLAATQFNAPAFHVEGSEGAKGVCIPRGVRLVPCFSGERWALALGQAWRLMPGLA